MRLPYAMGLCILYGAGGGLYTVYCSYGILWLLHTGATKSRLLSHCALAVTCVQHACVGKGGEARRGAVLYTLYCSYSRHRQPLPQERVMAAVSALSSDGGGVSSFKHA